MDLQLEDSILLAFLGLLALELYCLVRLFFITFDIFGFLLATINTWLHSK